jgi:hypothetical protein
VQFHDYGRKCCCPLSVEIIPGKHFDFINYLAKRGRALSGACAEVQFPDYGTKLWSPAVEFVPGKPFDFSIYLGKKVRTQSGACAEVQFPDYGTEL